MYDLLIPVCMLLFAFTTGTILEKMHYKSIKEREEYFLNLPAVTIKNLEHNENQVAHSHLVYGSAVISVDYFKSFLATLRNIFGGRVSTYESLVDRARREATLRLKESAMNADVIINLRIETATIGSKKNNNKDPAGSGSVEALAYGTAITYKK